MAEVIIDTSLQSIAELPAVLGFPGGSTTIELAIPGFPVPSFPKAKTDSGCVTFTVVQRCPGYPACGRKGQACEVRKSTPTWNLSSFGVPKIPIPSLPKVPVFKYTLNMPKLGFPINCPNAKVEATPAEKNSQNPSAQSGETASQK